MDQDDKTYQSEEERLAAEKFEADMKAKAGDRFEKISDDYGDLFSEVFEAEELDYGEFEHSIFATVEETGDYRDKPVMDIGVGDGLTSLPFVEAGYSDLTGLDLNPVMLRQAREKLGDKIKLIEGDATDLSRFSPGEFSVIITGASIHNILRTERPKLWAEMLRLEPEVIVFGEKIVDPDPVRHQTTYDNEVRAIDQVYRQNHGLEEANQIWQDHYIYDEQQRLELPEIEEALGDKYEIKVVFEMGMFKTVLAKRKRLAVEQSELETGAVKPEDRFEKISVDYGQLLTEVYKEQKLNYRALEGSVCEAVEAAGDYHDKPVLDIGVGDGLTSAPFVEAGYSDLTGLDLNPVMLRQAKERLGDKIKLVEGNAIDLSRFAPGDFSVIVTGTSIHNIPKADRPKLWSEMLRLKPEVIVMAEKIVDPDPMRHQATYEREIAAIDLVFRQNHGLVEENQTWQDHYVYDEQERLELPEIEEALGQEYEVKVVFEMGMCKTVLCLKKQ